MIKMNFHRPTLSGVLLIIILSLINLPTFAQQTPDDETFGLNNCPRISYLMENAQENGLHTPYDLNVTNDTSNNIDVGGGVLQVSEQTRGNFDEQYADIWSFQVPSTNNSDQINETIEIITTPQSPNLEIEVALFFGMDAIQPANEDHVYLPANDTMYSYTLRRAGIYSLVVRQTNLPYLDSTGTYTIDANLSSNRELPDTLSPLDTVRDESQNRAVDPAPIIQSNTGYQRIDLATTLFTHPNAVNNVSTLNNEQSRAEYGLVTGSGFFLDDIYTRVILLGGDLVITGTDPETNSQRLLYIEAYDYRTFFGDARGNPTGFMTQDGTNIQLNWDVMQGVWITRNCAGFMLRDGTMFMSPIVPEQRTVTFRSNRDIEGDFDIRVVAPDDDNTRKRYEIDLNWNAVRPGSLFTLDNGVLDLPLIGNRNFQVKSTQIDIRRDTDDALLSSENTPVLVTLADRETQLDLDWVDLNKFRLIDDVASFEFSDERDTVTRDASGLSQLIMRDGSVYTTYETTEQRLWLSESYGFIELITPTTSFPFDSLALPGEIGYVSNALNNTGGECYVVNTLLPEANCPPNGHPNPANGNLWYSITDQQAYGGHLDLILSRNYNSRLSAVDGPFGYGWTGIFLLDYNVPFDPTNGARQVDVEIARNYPVNLNIMWAPKGQVTFTTMSGSQHTFRTTSNTQYAGGQQTLTAPAMPGWTLTRQDVFSEWLLNLPDGLTYQFDPAGRLEWYGYNEDDRIVVDYPSDTLNGPASINDTPVIISDQRDSRQLELYYNEAHRIERSILRATNPTESTETCNPEIDGLQSIYTYDEGGFLTDVTYPDCQIARYDYNNGILNYHDDPRAPIATEMLYRYDENGFEQAVILPDDEIQPPGSQAEAVPEERNNNEDIQQIIWRVRTEHTVFNDVNNNNPITLQVALAGDEYPERTFTYNLVARASLNNALDAYTLASQIGPFVEEDLFEERPINYRWDAGLLSEELSRTIPTVELRGRNSIRYDYAPNGLITGITSGYPGFTAELGNDLQNLSFGDGTTIRITLNENGYSYIDRNSGEYLYTINARGYVETAINTVDQTAIDYTYNAYGLVESVSHYLVDADNQSIEAIDTRHTLNYSYDFLGRLIQIEDSLLGNTTIAYPAPERVDVNLYDNNNAEISVTDIVITDPTAATTHLRFDNRGRLIENRLEPAQTATLEDIASNNSYLNYTVYTYDFLGRLRTETRLLPRPENTAITQDTDPNIGYTTHYNYLYGYYPFDEDILPISRQTDTNRPSNVSTNADNGVNGYQIITTLPDGRQFARVYDALDRVRQVEDEFRNIERYDYIVAFEDDNPFEQLLTNGIMIEQHNYLSTDADPNTRIRYYFDLTWQLRYVVRQPLADNSPIDEQSWSILTQTNEQTDEQFDRLFIDGTQTARFEWADFDNGLPVNVALNPSDPTLPRTNAAISIENIPLQIRYDGMGRPVQVQTGTEEVYTTCYTVLEGHNTQVYTTTDIPFLSDISDPTATTESCDTSTIEGHNQSVQYDPAGRVIFTADASGTRTYTYEGFMGGWNVMMTTTVDTTTFIWQFTYDSAGQLIKWVDDNDIERIYTYDSLGQLTQVQTGTRDDETNTFIVNNEASYTFTYNRVGALTSVTDQLRRGTRYTYNTLGLLTVIQDVSTADATIYGYDSAGLLSTVISPSGNSTNYLYEDPLYPTRVTGIIEPNGNILTFEWNDEDNQLIYRNGTQSVIYAFDSAGVLWGIRENTRDHELRYNNAGALTEWVQSIDEDDNRARTLQFGYESPSAISINEPDSPNWTLTLESTLDNQLAGLSTIDANNAQTDNINAQNMSFTYDALGRLNTITSSLIASEETRVWTLAYGNDAPNIVFTDERGETSILTYDALNRLVSTIDDRVQTNYIYEPIGNEVRLSATVNGEPTARRVTYTPGMEGVGPPTISIAAPGQRITYVYNADGLIEEIRTEICLTIDEENNGENAEFDCVNGDERDVWRTIETIIYDTLGRPIRYIDPENTIAIYNYGPSGNLISYQNLEGQTFTYDYNEFNNLVAINSPTGNRLVAGYDALNNVIALCRTNASDLSPCTPESESDILLEAYAYDTLGRLTAQTFSTVVDEAQSQTTVTQEYNEPYGSLTTWGSDPENSVTLIYSTDGLERVTGINIDEPEFRLGFENLDRVNTVNISPDERITYGYDDFGRLEQIMTAEHVLSYRYDANNAGYTIRDENSGAEIHFALNQSGLLHQIAYDTENALTDAPRVSVDFEYQFNNVNRLLVVRLLWSNEEIVEISLDRNGITRNTFYNVQSNLSVNMPDAPSGFVRQYDITGSEEFFDGDSRGYIMLIGYDNDNRPLNMRITGRESGQLLYLQTFNYNNRGQRTSEIRQYADGDQITITYRYNDAGQLSEREFVLSRVRALSGSASPLLFLLSFLGGLVGWRAGGDAFRLRIMIGAGILLLAFSGISIVDNYITIAQQVDSFQQTISYDQAGNISTIDFDGALAFNEEGQDNQVTSITCAGRHFTYDEANRLRRVETTDGEVISTYGYDAYNRLISIGSTDFIYHGDSDTLLASFTEGDEFPIIYGQTAGRAGFFRAQGENIEWMITDGAQNTLNIQPAGDESFASPIFIDDPLGRPVIQDWTRTDWCAEALQFDELAFMGQLNANGVWDAESNLYFLNGRTYSPQLGVFLQRDPLGPDVFGTVYAYPSRESQPPLAKRNPLYAEGIYSLDSAIQAITLPDTLTATIMRESFMPSRQNLAIEPLFDHIENTTRITHNRLFQNTALRVWLDRNYNLSGASPDENGALRLSSDNAPGYGGNPNSRPINALAPVVYPETVFLPQINTSLQNLELSLAHQNALHTPYTTYQPFAWQPQPPLLSDAWQINRPLTGNESIPSEVWGWLPQTLMNPASAIDTLQAIERALILPTIDGQSWLETALDHSLPTLPELPPENAETWLENWFTDDIFGITDQLQQRFPHLPTLDVPVYTLGENRNWLNLDSGAEPATPLTDEVE